MINKKIIAVSAIALMALTSLPVFADTLNRQLDIGSTGSDVSSLQTFLSTDGNVYPQKLVTGYFGSLTSGAVSNFQTLNGIPAVGRVGPITLVALNQQMAGGVSTSGSAPTISGVSVSPSRNNATVYWNTNQSSQGVVYYSTSPLTTYEHPNSVDVSGNVAMTDNSFRTSQGVALQGLQANTTYYYMVYTTNQSGGVSVTWPSTFNTTN